MSPLSPEANNSAIKQPLPRTSDVDSKLSATADPLPSVQPRDFYNAILSATGCPPDQLSVTHVTDHDLVTSILSYAALFVRHANGRDNANLHIPFLKSIYPAAKQAAAAAMRRYARNGRRFGGRFNDDMNFSSDENAGSEDENDDDGDEDEQDKTNHFNHRPKAPVVLLAHGVAAVDWPPPPYLSAEAVADMEDKADTNGVSLHTQLRPAAAKATTVIPATAATTSTSVSAAPDEETREEAVISSTPTRIFILNNVPHGENEPIHTMIATPGSHDALIDFTSGVLLWSSLRAKRKAQTGRYFGLYRLRFGSWNREADRRVRALDSVFMPGAQKDALVRDARRFFSASTRRWYAKHGVPYRRAYLFHGPPGTGKTSMVRALASTLERNCCFVSMIHAATPEHIADAMGQLPERPLLVIEDVDAVFHDRVRSDSDDDDDSRDIDNIGSRGRRRNRKGRSGVSQRMTFSGLLNILDGMISATGVLTIMTTNHIERLDPAAIRAGRVDRRFYFGPAEDDVLRAYFASFYPDATTEVAERFVGAVERIGVEARSLATLQELFIEMRDESAETCVEQLPVFMEQYVERRTLRNELEEKSKADAAREEVEDGSLDGRFPGEGGMAHAGFGAPPSLPGR